MGFKADLFRQCKLGTFTSSTQSPSLSDSYQDCSYQIGWSESTAAQKAAKIHLYKLLGMNRRSIKIPLEVCSKDLGLIRIQLWSGNQIRIYSGPDCDQDIIKILIDHGYSASIIHGIIHVSNLPKVGEVYFNPYDRLWDIR